MTFQYDDGGREAAGFKGQTGDCVCRSIAIVTGLPYQAVYFSLNECADSMRQTKRVRGSHARTGVNRSVYEKYLKQLGWTFVPTMKIGSGCKVHLVASELPPGRIIARLSRHLCAVVDGVIHDTHDPSRNGTRCVYGYFTESGNP
jgi:hypothetical protein